MSDPVSALNGANFQGFATIREIGPVGMITLRAKGLKSLDKAIKSVTATNIKQRAGFKLTDYLGLGLQALGRRQIVDIYGDLVPLAEYNRLVQQMEADKNEGGAEADKLVTRWADRRASGTLTWLSCTLAEVRAAVIGTPQQAISRCSL